MSKQIGDLRIVIIGGGTGLSNILRGLKNYTDHITAIVTMSDDGKSSGRLRKDFHILPPGDIRNCILALSNEEQLYHKIFNYRFPHGRGIKGHSLGNLLMVALSDITGSFKKGIQEMSHILNIKGQVFPSTYNDVIISAKLANGLVVWGESNIPTAGHRSPIREIKLHPESAEANPDAIRAIEKSDLIIIGPGSLYTSIIPNFLLSGIRRAVSSSRAKKYFICNVSTERGETEDFSIEDHINTLVKYSDPQIFDVALVNNNIILKTSGRRLGEVKNIASEKNKIGRFEIINADLIDEQNPLYHDSEKVVKTILKNFTK